MKHRDFMDLTYKEIVQIVKDVLSDNFSNIQINSIQKDYDVEKIQVIVGLNGQNYKGNEIILRMPTAYDSGIYAPVNSHTTEDRAKMDKKYQQFILATLYRDLLKDNPYLEKDDSEIILTPDMQKFLDGRLVIYIENQNDYSDFINKLQQLEVKIDNPMMKYDPEYPYFFVDNPEDKHINANMFYDVINFVTFCNVEECIEYADLNFVKNQDDLEKESDEPDLD